MIVNPPVTHPLADDEATAQGAHGGAGEGEAGVYGHRGVAVLVGVDVAQDAADHGGEGAGAGAHEEPRDQHAGEGGRGGAGDQGREEDDGAAQEHGPAAVDLGEGGEEHGGRGEPERPRRHARVEGRLGQVPLGPLGHAGDRVAAGRVGGEEGAEAAEDQDGGLVRRGPRQRGFVLAQVEARQRRDLGVERQVFVRDVVIEVVVVVVVAVVVPVVLVFVMMWWRFQFR